MKAQQKSSAAALAMAAGLMLASATAPQAASAGEAKVHCYGINACKGQTACATANNNCMGMNACKGQGWLATATEEECKAKGGTVK